MSTAATHIYTGIGSRQTPPEVCQHMRGLARELANRGWLLRSGGASGADMAFEAGCDASFGRKEIYLPWFQFNGSGSRLHRVPKEAFEVAAKLHGEEVFKFYKRPVKLLHARNVQQVCGETLGALTHVVLCWTPGGRIQGGTRTAIMLAEEMGVPVVNLATRLITVEEVIGEFGGD